MMRNLMIAALVAGLPSLAYCEGEEQAPLSQEVLDQLAALPDNTGATNPNDSTADIVQTTGESSIGAIEGEVTIRRTSAGVDVYNGLNKVESIPDGSDGWVGRVTDNTSSIDFVPTGRPKLSCPAQSITSWYGPCKVGTEG